MNRHTGVLVVDLSGVVDPFGGVAADARSKVGRVLAAAPRGVAVEVDLGAATYLDPAVERVLVSFAARHPIRVRGSQPRLVGRLVALLRGERDVLGEYGPDDPLAAEGFQL